MTLKILHTGDLHIGKKFSDYPADTKEKLSAARLDSLGQMMTYANENKVDLFVISGDMFDRTNIAKDQIIKTAKLLNTFKGKVLILPGNHDYDDGELELWTTFKNESNNSILLSHERVYDLEEYDFDILVYPAPCHAKHSDEHNLSWINDIKNFDSKKLHIGIAHGALEGLSLDAEGKYYAMTMRDLESLPIDLWLLGHTHVPYPMQANAKNHKIFNAGTHEPDGMNYRYPGQAWIIEIDKNKIEAQQYVTGKYRFCDENHKINNKKDLEDIHKWVKKNQPETMILRLNLEGSLNSEDYDDLPDFYKKVEKDIVFLKINDNKLRRKITDKLINDEFVEGSFPHVFLSKLIDDADALQLAYEIVRRSAK